MPKNTSFWYQSDHKVLVHLIVNSVHPVSLSICQKKWKFWNNCENCEKRKSRKSRKTLDPGPPGYSYTLYSTKVAENARSGTSRKSAKTKTKTVHYHSDKGKTPITFEPVNGFSISQVLRTAYCKGYRPVWSNHSLFTVHILHFVLTDIKQRYCAYRDHRMLVCLLVTRPAYFRHKSVSSIGLKRWPRSRAHLSTHLVHRGWVMLVGSYKLGEYTITSKV